MEKTKINKVLQKAQMSQRNIDVINESFVIIPYQSSGYLDITNFGYIQEQLDVNSFETFKRVWTGNDAIILNWKNSLLFTQNEETKEISTKVQLGEVLIGLLLDNQGDVELEKDQSFGEYISQQNKETVNFRINKFYGSIENYSFYFYKIPELFGSILFRIESINPEIIGLEIVGYNVTFVTVNQDIANSGRAKQQNVMPNSPGQGYLEARVFAPNTVDLTDLIDGKDYFKLPDGRIITGDKTKVKNNPVVRGVVKCFGPAVFSNISLQCRKIKEGEDMSVFGEPTIAFAYNLLPTFTPTLYRSQSAENNFYWIYNASLLLLGWKDFFENIKGAMTPVNEFKYQGFISYDREKTKATNPLVNGSYKNQLFGYLQFNESTGRYDSFPWDINLPPVAKKNNMVYGSAKIYNVGGIKRIWDHMFDAYWTQKKYITLPLNTHSTLGYGWTLGSSLGALVTGKYWAGALLLGLGIVGSTVNKYIGPNFEGISGIVSAPLIDLAATQFPSEQASPDDKISLSVFDTSNGDNPASAFFDGSTMQTAFQFDLVDTFISARVPNKKLTSANVGQTTFKDGTNILPSGEAFLLNGDSFLSPIEDFEEDKYGFIVDSFNIQAICNGEFSMEFLDKNDNVIWNGVFQTEGKWTGSTREFNTWKNTSVFNRENTFFSEPLPYPKPPLPLTNDLNAFYDLRKFYNVVLTKSTINSQYGSIVAALYSGLGYQVEQTLSYAELFTRVPEIVYNDLYKGSYSFSLPKTRLFDTKFQSLEQFWNTYSDITFSLRTSKQTDYGSIQSYNNISITLFENENFKQTILNDNISSSWLDFSKSFQNFNNSIRNKEVIIQLTLENEYVMAEIVFKGDNLILPALIATSTENPLRYIISCKAYSQNLAWEPYEAWVQQFCFDSVFFKAK